jgi:hypothetical protein
MAMQFMQTLIISGAAILMINHPSLCKWINARKIWIVNPWSVHPASGYYEMNISTVSRQIIDDARAAARIFLISMGDLLPPTMRIAKSLSGGNVIVDPTFLRVKNLHIELTVSSMTED